MLLTARHIDALYTMMGDEPSPGTGMRSWIESVVNTLAGDLWARRIDLVIAGGDPLLAMLAAAAFDDVADAERSPRIAIIRNPTAEAAPISALEDDAVLESFLEERILPPSCARARHLPPGVRVEALAEILADRLAVRMETGRLRLWIASAPLQACRSGPEDIIFRLQDCPSTPPGSLQHLSEEVRHLRSRSEHAHDAAWRRAMTRLSGLADKPPARRNFATVFVGRECLLLSGFISAGRGIDPGSGLSLAAADISARALSFAQGDPFLVRDALQCWRDDFRAVSTWKERA